MTTDLFVGVPVDDLHRPLMLAESENEENQITTGQEAETTTTMFQRYTTLAHFFMGTTLGVVFSTAGFELLLKGIVAPTTTLYIVGFSCIWSFGTYFLAYLLFEVLHPNNNGQKTCDHCSEQSTLQHECWEYVYALGVFIGFCFACVVTDVHYGMPVRSLTWTLGSAVIWLLFMVVFLVVRENDKPSHTDGTDSRDDDVGRGVGEVV